ncbi:MAG: YgjV family protein [Clostridia bacterium]|nr:YgjV family protein [Clostridia bacterium]
MKTLAFVIGAVAVIVNLTIYWQNERRKLLLTKVGTDILWGLHYGLLGAFSGTGIALISIVRGIVFLNEEKKWASGKKWLWIFLVLSLLSAVLTYKNPSSLLPLFASLMAVVSFWQKKPHLTRLLAFPIALSMLIYDIYVGSVMGIVNESIVIISASLAVIKLKSKE